jgi:RNA-directed DNA polymerase
MEHFYPETNQLMDAVVERENLGRALQRVERNKGAAGVDDMPVQALRAHLKEHWPRIKAELLEGRYQPSPVLRLQRTT